MAKRGTLDDNTVWRVEEIKKIPNSDEARKLLLRVKEHADNVLKARGWKVKRLIEICCCERKNMGTNLGVGGWCRGDGPGAAHTIALRLRRPRSHEFVSFEHCLKVMWHEMAHIVHGNHSAAFYQEMDDIARHYELIKSKGQESKREQKAAAAAADKEAEERREKDLSKEAVKEEAARATPVRRNRTASSRVMAKVEAVRADAEGAAKLEARIESWRRARSDGQVERRDFIRENRERAHAAGKFALFLDAPPASESAREASPDGRLAGAAHATRPGST